MYREIVLAASWTSSKTQTSNEKKTDEEPASTQNADENIKPEKNKLTLIKSPEVAEKAELETTEKINNGWRRPKNFKRPVAHKRPTAAAKLQEKKNTDTNEKQGEAKPKEAGVHLGQCDDWTDYL